MSSYIQIEHNSDGIVDLIFDQPGKKVNTMGVDFNDAMQAAISKLEAMVAAGNVKGIYLSSAKKGQFFAGGDIKEMMEMDLNPPIEAKQKLYDGILEAKQPLRRLETIGVPVAVAINGACLGGGYEIALSCNYRVAMAGVQIGLPEAAIGLMPGAGGVVRLTRLIGIQEALPLISQGKRLKAEKALDKKMIDFIVDDENQLEQHAKAWILANPNACQPWDSEQYKIPGGGVEDKNNEATLYFGPANIMVKTKGLMPAQQAIFSCISDSLRVDIDTAQKIEARYFLSLILDQTSRNMMTTFFVQMEALNRGASRPADFSRAKLSNLGIIGGGQMGAGIAVAAAQKGIAVIIKDVSVERAQTAISYAQQALAKNRRLSDDQRQQVLALIKVTDDYADMSNADLVIEAVFENREIKAEVTVAVESVVSKTAIIASNTSALPISGLAKASANKGNFIGMHFFSPAEKMPLVEIICGDETSQEALAKAFDYSQQLGKMPIVVNDAPGFFTTRVIGKTVAQGSEMLVEGINPVLIESAARDNGSPIGPLGAIDEISQETAYNNGLQAKQEALANDEPWQETNAFKILDVLVNQYGRKGKNKGGGYYEYPEQGNKHIWPGLKSLYAEQGFKEIPYQDIRDRLLFSQSLEAVRAMQEGVINSAGDGNIGSIMGIGFPAQTGGVFQYINAYGLSGFVQRSRELASRYGDVFEPPQLLIDRAENNQYFV